MSTASNVDVVQKLWGFCHTLRHDGIDYGDYIEQITYLLFLKMGDEHGIEPHIRLARVRKNAEPAKEPKRPKASGPRKRRQAAEEEG